MDIAIIHKTMPHSRTRYATPILQQLLTHSPIVGVLGQRQTGKTTLSDSLSTEYSSLDDPATLEWAKNKPAQFLEKRAVPFTIDECQLVPALFPALKERVRIHPRKGQFILTGSVRFTSRKAIRESLTGRIVNLELLPFSPAESHGEALPEKITQWIKTRTFQEIRPLSARWIQKMHERFRQFLVTGGLPGICFFRKNSVRAPRFETHLETLLERDIRLLLNTTTSYRQLKKLSTLLALNQGMPVNYSELASEVGISAPSIKKLISAMEGMFLVRSISTEGQSSPVVFFEDQGTASYLIGDQATPERDLIRGIFSCLLPQFLYRPELGSVFSQYRTRSGAQVDLVIRTHLGTIGIISVTGDAATPSSLSSARSFLSSTSGAKIIIAHQGKNAAKVSDSILSIPYPMLISDHWDS